MTISKKDTPALLLIDVQKGFEDIKYWGSERNNLYAETNIELLLKFWRANNLPVFHIKHCSTTPNSPLKKGSPGNDFQDFIIPKDEEPIIEKEVNSAFIGTDLQEQLESKNINTLVIIGLTTDHCVSTTTRMAGNYGFTTYLVEDAVATFDKTGTNGRHYSAQLIHDTAIASLKDEFASILSTESLLKYVSKK
ncbi:cysteine hydrolase family protein [Aquimarina mytili]|uniref:Cysteine hydrolase n=1 Tax=Aquimarina mytili TaxID=874423 RepID=A0A937DA54_9FLAO|nr:cysteine hydrolase family protein [Aquimarina mytili]MBL0684402.1 cysteine hydrolase [Aquimarina mytili]